jgi:hypothetical protein
VSGFLLHFLQLVLLLQQFVIKLRVPSCRRSPLARRELYGTFCHHSIILAALLRARPVRFLVLNLCAGWLPLLLRSPLLQLQLPLLLTLRAQARQGRVAGGGARLARERGLGGPGRCGCSGLGGPGRCGCRGSSPACGGGEAATIHTEEQEGYEKDQRQSGPHAGIISTAKRLVLFFCRFSSFKSCLSSHFISQRRSA